MVIFVNDVPIKFKVESEASIKSRKTFSTIVKSREGLKNLKQWKKRVLIPEASSEIIEAFFSAIKEVKRFSFKNVTFLVTDIEMAKAAVFTQYKIVDAAGGVILNDKNEVLMIHRLGKWDLPKGKAEKGETIIETAEREVEEECAVTVKVLPEHIISYHTYLHKNQRVLKRTFWYKMELISDEFMTPQKEEKIDDIKWKGRSKMHKALKNSYTSIRFVLDNLLSQDLSFSKG